jgi:hypothetical protein
VTAMNEPRFLVSLALGEGDARLIRIPLAKLGRWFKGKMRFAITRETMAEILRNFGKRENGEVVLDYEHASEHPEWGNGGPVPAAGWLREVEAAPDPNGILWGSVEFTKRARQLIEAGEYKYISPSLSWGARDKKTGDQQGCTLTSVALVNRPFLEGLPAIALSEVGWEVEDGEQQGERTVQKLQLAEGGKVAVMCECGKCVQTTTRVICLSDVPKSRGRFDFSDLPAGPDVLIASEVLRAHLADGELQKALESGKITPAQFPVWQEIALSDLPRFRTLMASMRPQIDFSERGFSGNGEGVDGSDEKGKIDHLIEMKAVDRMKSDSNLTFSQALKLAASEAPDLVRRRDELERPKH